MFLVNLYIMILSKKGGLYMNKEVILVLANYILANYNLELRYARYTIDKPLVAELIVKDSRKEFRPGLIKITKDEIVKFYVGKINFQTDSYEVADKFHKELILLYKDIEKLNTLSLLYMEADEENL